MPEIIWRLFPSWVDAFAWNEKIHVRPGRVLTEALKAHELVHLAQQQQLGKWRFVFEYFSSKRKRLKFEIEAYLKSIEYGLPVRIAAEYLVKTCSVSLADALKTLEKVEKTNVVKIHE